MRLRTAKAARVCSASSWFVGATRGCRLQAGEVSNCEKGMHLLSSTAASFRVRFHFTWYLSAPVKLVVPLGRWTGHPVFPQLGGEMYWAAIRQGLKMSVATHGGWCSLTEAVEKEFLGVFLLAAGDVPYFRGRTLGHKVVWKACRGPWRDTYPRVTFQAHAWHRNCRVCKDMPTAGQRSAALLLSNGDQDDLRSLGMAKNACFGTTSAPVDAVARALVEVSGWVVCVPLRCCLMRLMELEASHMADQAIRMARRRRQRWLEDNTQ